jgi:hypothetical protein
VAIARIFEGRGWTAEQYDQLIARMDLRGHAAQGVLFHWASKTPDGMRAIDVYESREAADRLAQEKIGPAAAELQLPPPEITEMDVHAFLTPA